MKMINLNDLEKVFGGYGVIEQWQSSDYLIPTAPIDTIIPVPTPQLPVM